MRVQNSFIRVEKFNIIIRGKMQAKYYLSIYLIRDIFLLDIKYFDI